MTSSVDLTWERVDTLIGFGPPVMDTVKNWTNPEDNGQEVARLNGL